MNPKLNNNESLIFQIESIRQRTPEQLTNEHVIFLATLYNRRIIDGDHRMKDYADMTMFDVNDEIQFRTAMLHADNQRAVNEWKKKRRIEQDDAVNELLNLQLENNNTTI